MRGASRRLAIGLAVVVIMLPASLSLAQVDVQGPALSTRSYTTPLVIPAAAFLTNGIDPDGYLFEDGHIQGQSTETHLVAPVYLPHRVHVRSLRAYILDNSGACDVGDEDVEVFLSRVALATGTAQTIAITTSEGAANVVDFTPTFSLTTSRAEIDNNEYAYWLNMKICSVSHRLYAVVIEY